MKALDESHIRCTVEASKALEIQISNSGYSLVIIAKLIYTVLSTLVLQFTLMAINRVREPSWQTSLFKYTNLSASIHPGRNNPKPFPNST